MKNVLLLGGANPAHQPRDVTAFVADYLEELGDIAVTITEDTSILESSAADAYDAFLLYLNTQEERWPQSREAAFLDAVTRGKGLLVLHAGVLSFRGWEAYSEIIGGKPTPDFYHPPYGPFAVHIDDASHPITANMVDFAVRDELYANVQLTSQARLLAHATLNGKPQPLLWVLEPPQTRVCTLLLGHDRAALQYPGASALLKRGVAWVAGAL
jgi:type 1 glutamine amidotransferase